MLCSAALQTVNDAAPCPVCVRRAHVSLIKWFSWARYRRGHFKYETDIDTLTTGVRGDLITMRRIQYLLIIVLSEMI